MKKYLVLAICMILILTGCSNQNENIGTKQSNNKKQEVEEIKEENITTTTLITDETKASNKQEVVEYIEDIDKQISNYTKSTEQTPEIKEKLKNTFITLTDFAFYGGTIKGITFNELSSSAKEKVLNIIDSIDSKIERVSPNYKETIKASSNKVYTNIKEQTKILKDQIVKQYQENTIEETKDKVSSTYNSTKEKLTETIDTVEETTKNVYGNIKDKVSSWYENFKESSD